jgi:hypothetical protein
MTLACRFWDGRLAHGSVLLITAACDTTSSKLCSIRMHVPAQLWLVHDFAGLLSCVFINRAFNKTLTSRPGGATANSTSSALQQQQQQGLSPCP